MNEIWRPIRDYEGYYEVSNFGRVRSLDRWIKLKDGRNRLQKGKIIKADKTKNGYLRVMLCKNHKQKHFSIHRLVAQAFIPNPHNYPIINHKDECKTNNRVDNLEYCDISYNNSYGTRNERISIGLSKPILQFDLEGNFIKEWSSMMEASRNGFGQGNICNCCNGKLKNYKGYIWKKKEEVY